MVRSLDSEKLINRNDLPEAARQSILRKFDPGIIQIVYEFKSIDSPTRYYVHLVTSRHSVLVSANEFGQIGFSQKERLK